MFFKPFWKTFFATLSQTNILPNRIEKIRGLVVESALKRIGGGGNGIDITSSQLVFQCRCLHPETIEQLWLLYQVLSLLSLSLVQDDYTTLVLLCRSVATFFQKIVAVLPLAHLMGVWHESKGFIISTHNVTPLR